MWADEVPFIYSDGSKLTLSLLRCDPRHSHLDMTNGTTVPMNQMADAYWDACIFPHQSQLVLEDNHGNEERTCFNAGSSMRKLINRILRYYHQPASTELAEQLKGREWFMPEDPNDVRVTDLMEGLVTSSGMERARDGTYSLVLFMY